MKTKDKVKSRFSLWSGDIGTISGIIKMEDSKSGDLVHVIFPENDKHYGYQQSFYSKDLLVVS